MNAERVISSVGSGVVAHTHLVEAGVGMGGRVSVAGLVLLVKFQFSSFGGLCDDPSGYRLESRFNKPTISPPSYTRFIVLGPIYLCTHLINLVCHRW